MKLDTRQAAAFLRDPGAARLVLLHGDDEGQIRDQARTLTLLIAGSLSDPFLVAELGRDNWNRISDEMSALSLIGGRRVVIARDATDAILPFVTAALAGPGEALLIVEAPGLGKGKLRSYAEAASHGAVLASYAEEGAALQATITRMLSERDIRVEPDAMVQLCQTLAADRAVLRGEIDKLALFATPGVPLDAETIKICIGDGANSMGDDAILAMMVGEVAQGDAALEHAFADAFNGVAMLRLAAMHLQKLHQAKLRIKAGASVGQVVAAMRPPIFYKNVGVVTKSLAAWSTERLMNLLGECRRVELACKQTGSSPNLLARRFLHQIGRSAR